MRKVPDKKHAMKGGGFVSSPKNWLLIFCWSLTLVIALIAVFSDRGLFDLQKIADRQNALTAEIIRLEHEKIIWEARVDSLRNGTEYYEIIARQDMGFIGKDERLYEIQEQ